jgi:hypothetical protein
VGDERLLLPGTARLRKSVAGPTLAAAFYRRDIVVALEGFDSSVPDRLADIEMALAIEQLGRLHVCEPASRFVLSGPSLDAGSSGGFSYHRACERLFWRYAPQRGLVASLLCHPFAALSAAAAELPKAAAVRVLAGRLWAHFEFGQARNNQRRIAAAAERLAELNLLRANIRAKEQRRDVPRRRAA